MGIHPDDLANLGLHEGDLVRVSSRRGSLVLPVQGDAGLRPGHTWLPMHWGDRFLRGLGTNVLTQPGFDPLSRQPELKLSGVALEPADLPGGCSRWSKVSVYRTSMRYGRCWWSSPM